MTEQQHWCWMSTKRQTGNRPERSWENRNRSTRSRLPQYIHTEPHAWLSKYPLKSRLPPEYNADIAWIKHRRRAVLHLLYLRRKQIPGYFILKRAYVTSRTLRQSSSERTPSTPEDGWCKSYNVYERKQRLDPLVNSAMVSEMPLWTYLISAFR